MAYYLSRIFGKKIYLRIKNVNDYIKRKRENIIIKRYTDNRSFIVNSIKGEKTINVIFFLYSLSMWKYDGLFRMLSKCSRFNPIIIPFILPENQLEISLDENNKIISYCQRNHFNFINAFDFNKGSYSEKIYSIRPDIIIYTQPYNRGVDKLKIHNFLNRSLFIYTPYGVTVDHDPMFYDTLLQNIAILNFLSSPLEYEVQKKFCRNRGSNVKVVGLQLSDELQITSISPWKKDNRKKIIWAPHHSISATDPLSNSTFLDICDFMYKYAESMKDKIQFAFKPHPSLKGKLYSLWGKEKTDKYYDSWSSLDSSFVSEGKYNALFQFSDALIHDCSSFSCEYLLTHKPTLYLTKNNHILGLNSFGIACYKQHYLGYCLDDIVHFVEDIVINNNDRMYEDRVRFVNNYLIPPNNKKVCENMFEAMVELFK